MALLINLESVCALFARMFSLSDGPKQRSQVEVPTLHGADATVNPREWHRSRVRIRVHIIVLARADQHEIQVCAAVCGPEQIPRPYLIRRTRGAAS
jgi:hypothetical protein